MARDRTVRNSHDSFFRTEQNDLHLHRLVTHAKLVGSGNCAENPPNYKNPGERGMIYKNVEIITKDNERIHG